MYVFLNPEKNYSNGKVTLILLLRVHLNNQYRNITGLKESNYSKLKVETENVDNWNQRLR